MPIDSVGGFGWTALQCAAMSNQTDVIHEFLERGANVNKQWDCLGLTGLNLSAPNKKTDVIRLLLQYRASTNIKDDKGQKPIDWTWEEPRRSSFSAGLLNKVLRQYVLTFYVVFMGVK